MSTDFGTVDESNLDGFLISICPELSIYTYDMLQLGFDRDLLFKLTNDNMQSICGMKNPVHKMKLADALQGMQRKLMECHAIELRFTW